MSYAGWYEPKWTACRARPTSATAPNSRRPKAIWSCWTTRSPAKTCAAVNVSIFRALRPPPLFDRSVAGVVFRWRIRRAELDGGIRAKLAVVLIVHVVLDHHIPFARAG